MVYILWNGRVRRYEGELRTGKPHGAGKLFDCRGTLLYAGEFHHGVRHGVGTVWWPNGATYEGQWRAGWRHGEGTCTFGNGVVYVGTWERNRRHGPGTCTYGDTRLEVTFKDDRIVHVKEFVSERLRYEGGWESPGGRTGHGVLYGDDGKAYDGEWAAGKEHGWGTAYTRTGTVRFRGMWTDGAPDREATKRRRAEDAVARKRRRVRDRVAAQHASAAVSAAVGPVPTCALCLEDVHHGDPSYVYVPCGHRALCGACGAAPPAPWHRQCVVCKREGATLCRVY
jgi:hypothetical protein